MMSKYSHLLPLCYEIEGLICLMNQRGNYVPPEVYQLMRDKIHSLSAQIETFAGENEEVSPAIENTPRDTGDSAEITAPTPEAVDSTSDEENDESIAESAIYEETADAEPQPEPVAEEEPITEESHEPETHASVPSAPKFKISYFSVNDRYRFRRELFNFDDAEMEDTIDALSNLSDEDEIMDYLANDLCWDVDDETVQDFISIILSKRK